MAGFYHDLIMSIAGIEVAPDARLGWTERR